MQCIQHHRPSWRLAGSIFLTLVFGFACTERAFADPQNPAQLLLRRGLEEFRRGEFDKAIAAYSQAIQQDPKLALAWVGRSMALAAKNDAKVKTAKGPDFNAMSRPIEDDYLEAMRHDPQAAESFAKWAGIKARQDVQEFIRRIEVLAAVHIGASAAQIIVDKWNEGMAELDRAVALLLDYPVARFKRGYYLKELGQFDKAIADFDALEQIYRQHKSGFRGGVDLAADEKTREAFYHLALVPRGAAYRGKGEARRAIAEFDEAIRLMKGVRDSEKMRSSAFMERGLADTLLGAPDQAIADFTEAIRLDPENHEALYRRAAAYAERNQLARARADIDEAIRLSPHRAEYYYVRGQIYAAEKEPAKAIGEFSEAIRLAPKLIAAFVHRGRSYLALGDADQSLANFDQVLRLHADGLPLSHGDLLTIHQDRARAFELKGDRTNARAERNKAKEYESPQVVRTLPRSGDREVDPALTEIVVVFDKAMATDGWSISRVAGIAAPEAVGATPASFRDATTFVLKVKLQPATEYALDFNAGGRPGFISASRNIPAKPFRLRFKTRTTSQAADSDGPRVTQTDPPDGASKLDAGTFDLKIVFDEPMKSADAMFVIPAGSPKLRVVGKSKWKDSRTWVVPVLLAPGVQYRVGINIGDKKPFTSAGDGTPARPHEWTFKTNGAVGPSR